MPKVAFVFLVGLLVSLSVATAFGQETGQSFRDDFDQFNRGRWMISDGWTNGDWMNCDWSRRAVRVRDGALTFTLAPPSKKTGTLNCGEIQSRDVYEYGTFEIMFRTGRASGLNAAFFTYIGPVHDQPHDEIDVEVLLRNPDEVSFNTYVDATQHNGKSVSLPVAADTQFLHYAFTWSPEGVIWYVNGDIRHRTEPGSPIPVRAQKIFASLWSSDTLTDWMGPFDLSALPQSASVDWIAYTRLGEGCRFPESVLC